MAITPAAYGDFFGNFSLYRAASVHGRAEMVSPSCVSSEAVFQRSLFGSALRAASSDCRQNTHAATNRTILVILGMEL